MKRRKPNVIIRLHNLTPSLSTSPLCLLEHDFRSTLYDDSMILWFFPHHSVICFRDHYTMLLTSIAFKTQSTLFHCRLLELIFIAVIAYKNKRLIKRFTVDVRSKMTKNLINLTGNDNNHKLHDDQNAGEKNTPTKEKLELNYSSAQISHIIYNNVKQRLPALSLMVVFLFRYIVRGNWFQRT